MARVCVSRCRERERSVASDDAMLPATLTVKDKDRVEYLREAKTTVEGIRRGTFDGSSCQTVIDAEGYLEPTIVRSGDGTWMEMSADDVSRWPSSILDLAVAKDEEQEEEEEEARPGCRSRGAGVGFVKREEEVEELELDREGECE